MDLNFKFELLQHFILPHWPFFFMSFALGMIGQFMKKKVWTQERAQRGGFWGFMNDSLSIHAPVAGIIAGMVGFPVSPGVEGVLARVLYHLVAGMLSSWTVAAWKNFVRSRGIRLDELDTRESKKPQ